MASEKKSAPKKKKAATASAKPHAMSKTELLSELAEAGGVTKDVAGKMLARLEETCVKQLRGAAAKFTIPGVVMLTRRQTPARPARKGRNPATGAEIMIAAKPASQKIAARPAKAMKEAGVK